EAPNHRSSRDAGRRVVGDAAVSRPEQSVVGSDQDDVLGLRYVDPYICDQTCAGQVDKGRGRPGVTAIRRTEHRAAGLWLPSERIPQSEVKGLGIATERQRTTRRGEDR